MRKSTLFAFVLLLSVIVGSALYAHTHKTIGTSGKLRVVAAENFWGSLIAQIGGSKVQVTSIVSDPNADPHEYEVTSVDARSIATANYVIINGAGYDTWADKLLSASPNIRRVTCNIARLVGVPQGQDPHLWYNPVFVNEAIAQMEQDLLTLDPADKAYFQARYKALETDLLPYQRHVEAIKAQFAGTRVAATESVFGYLARATGLNLISPPAFTEAVSEGNDPPASSVVIFQQQLQSHQVHTLVYNKQTVTPLTSSIKQLANQQHIPTVGITETMQPPTASFETWMNAELSDLQDALNTQAPGR